MTRLQTFHDTYTKISANHLILNIVINVLLIIMAVIQMAFSPYLKFMSEDGTLSAVVGLLSMEITSINDQPDLLLSFFMSV